MLLALGRPIGRYTAWALVLASQTTTTVPALLGLSGNWPTGPVWTAAAALVAVAVFGGAAVLARRPHRSGSASDQAQTATPAVA